MVDPVDVFLGLLGHLASIQINCSEVLFETAREPIPWPSLVHPLWVELLLKLEVVWNGLDRIGVTVPL